MLRRYLIVNGVSTALMYGAFSACVPSLTSVVKSVRDTIDTYAMESAVLSPIVHRVVFVSGR